jgi:hypothetical protein
MRGPRRTARADAAVDGAACRDRVHSHGRLRGSAATIVPGRSAWEEGALCSAEVRRTVIGGFSNYRGFTLEIFAQFVAKAPGMPAPASGARRRT